MTAAQDRMMAELRSASAHEERRHPGSGGWVEWWDVVNDWGRHMPLGFVGNAATKCWRALERLGIVESHPEYADLVRPKR